MSRKETKEDRADRMFENGKRDAENHTYHPPHHWVWNTTVGSDQDRIDNDHYTRGQRAGKD